MRMGMNTEGASAFARKQTSSRASEGPGSQVVRGKPPSILASNGLSLLGAGTALQPGSNNPYDNVNKPKLTHARSDSANHANHGRN